MDLIRTVKRIEWATRCRWWLLAILLLLAARIPVLAVLGITLIAVACWVQRHVEADTHDDGGAA